ncbi:MAG: dienelactone hydrolase [Actinomycetia bacterium]|nr:dienelactone hydrolase [Actinomycetes bacterium]
MTQLLLFPGAGSSSTHSSLVAIEAAVSPMHCVREDFGYRKAGRKAPDRTPVLLQAVRSAAAPMLANDDRLVLGGRSMGGRMCSLAVADESDPVPAVGLVLICYPLHPPGKPESLRVEHFPRLNVPCLFISGTKDAFGSPSELEQWTATIPGAVTHHWLDGKGHDLKGCDTVIAQTVANWITALAS